MELFVAFDAIMKNRIFSAVSLLFVANTAAAAAAPAAAAAGHCIVVVTLRTGAVVYHWGHTIALHENLLF